MQTQERKLLLNMMKVLADERRLELIGWLKKGEYKVHDLAGLTGVTEPTISHHIAKLRSVGFVNLRQEGPQHFYSLNTERLGEFKQLVQHIDTLPETPEFDDSWVDALEFTDEEKRVLKVFVIEGRLRKIPNQNKKFLVVLKWLANRFETNRDYSESEVNSILAQHHEDFALLRRELVDYGYLRRERGGGRYWVAEESS